MSLRILVVEDDAAAAEALTMLLGSFLDADTELLVATNGLEGLQLVQALHFDLILTDYSMPEMNGLEFVSRMAEQGRLGALPVIVLSAQLTEDHYGMFLAKGVRAVMPKPFVIEQLRNTVHRLLQAA